MMEAIKQIFFLLFVPLMAFGQIDIVKRKLTVDTVRARVDSLYLKGPVSDNGKELPKIDSTVYYSDTTGNDKKIATKYDLDTTYASTGASVTLSTNQIAYGSGGNSIIGSPRMTFDGSELYIYFDNNEYSYIDFLSGAFDLVSNLGDGSANTATLNLTASSGGSRGQMGGQSPTSSTDTYTFPDSIVLQQDGITVLKITDDTIYNYLPVTIGDSKIKLYTDGRINLASSDPAAEDQNAGDIWYNFETSTFNLKNNISSVILQPGEEVWHPVYNNSGATISDGRLVRRAGYYNYNGKILPTIALAGNGSYDSSLVFGMATHDISNNFLGYVTKIGDVHDLNTSGISEGDTYLGNAGEFIDTSAPPPYFSVYIGECIYSDNDSGVIEINISQPTYFPRPVFSLDTIDIDSVLTNNGIGIYTKFPIGAVTPSQSNAYVLIGDSVRCDIAGNVNVSLNVSFQGNIQVDNWRTGIFKNGIAQYNPIKSTEGENYVNTTSFIDFEVDIGDYISFKGTNLSSATRTMTIFDFALSIIFTGE